MFRMWWHQRKIGHTPELIDFGEGLLIYVCSGCPRVWPAPKGTTKCC